MNIVSCLSPRLVRNPYTHDYISAKCGKCDMCLNTRSLQLQERIKSECSFHRFCVFFTLTYNNEHLPLYKRVGDSFIDEDGCVVCSSSLVDFSLSRLYHGDLPHVSKRDIQLFLKRLRKHIDKYYEGEKIRFIVSSEYGPSTFRPHYHGLLWFENPAIVCDFRKIIYSCWQNGYTNASIAGERSHSYVAKYVNCVSKYPKVFRQPETKPFALYSRCPALGVDKNDKTTLYESLFNAVDTRIVADNSKVESVPFLRSFENYFLPKCRKFNSSTLAERIAYYKCSRFPFIDVFHDFKNYAAHAIDRSISSRVYRLAHWLGVSIDCYIKRIIDYYSRKCLSNLKKLFAYEDKFAESYPLERFKLVQLYPNLCKCLTMSNDYGLKKPLLPLTIRYALRSFGLTQFNISQLNPFDNSSSDIEHIRLIKKCVIDSDKTKRFNDKYGLLNSLKIQYYECTTFK